ncbi:UNVERIFIED_CONTAM: hypothetical protein PYX00_003765 [Menopon gallinae]|uniref:Protein kinase n=1 Tax=Menopon gallinae TaxID=328185 RepID=A0AAW2I1P8_9NEOP
MGNEESHNRSVDFDGDAVEVTDNWTLYYAHNVNGIASVRSAFISQQGSSGRSSDSLKRLAKNLMIHRHPCIIQFVSSWSKNDSFYLITEEVKPLAQAGSSHNNLCCASIYVTPEGVWKLGGLDYLKKFSDVTHKYLVESRAHRYEKAVPPEEDSLLPSSKINPESIDQYAFGVLVEEVLKKKSNDDIPHLADFKAFCKKKLLSVDPSQRCKLSEIMSHQFFNHDFIRIHKFLSELPLKIPGDKDKFFRDLTVQLSELPEEIVASQLASLLLSRIVILDGAAQKHLLPIVLQPKTDDGGGTGALFSENTFKRHIVPRLLQMFCVRDAQVRFILLNHFKLFCSAFTTEQLKHQVLPELLMGIKDVNDQLVSTTLKALADLVLILGSSTVIGGKRAKLFTDGRPMVHQNSISGACSNKVKERDKGSPVKNSTHHIFGNNELPERLSPDGGEDNMSTTTVEEVEVDNETWSDWESPVEKEVVESAAKVTENSENPPDTRERETQPAKSGSQQHLQILSDFSALDIKCDAGNGNSRKGEPSKETDGEIDFFRDMEPVISKTHSLDIHFAKNKFDINVDAEDVGGEWDEGWALDDSDS